MNQFLALLFLSLGVALSLVAFFAVLDLFFPQRLAKTQHILEILPRRAFLVGLVNLAFFSMLVLVFANLGDSIGHWLPRLLAVIILIPLCLGLIFGLASIVRFAGERFAPQKNGLVRTAWGTLGLGLACALPFVGWFGLLPFVAILGLGALITSFFYRERPVPSSAGSDA